jgi:hypothetical protein
MSGGGDAAAIDALVARFYAAFDNRGGRRPSLETIRALFVPGATITRVSADAVEAWSVDAFAAPRIALLTSGALADFHEWETAGETAIGTRIASRRSTYAKRGVRDGRAEEGGGRKLLHVAKGADGWRIAAILWEDGEAPLSLAVDADDPAGVAR